jgi:RNA polymerase sigma-70 factor (ECF subfamily)
MSGNASFRVARFPSPLRPPVVPSRAPRPEADRSDAPASDADAARFEAQVRRHRDAVYRLACSLLEDRAEAADVTQEVLVKLWHYRGELEDGRTRAWLLRTARNACLDALRHRAVRRDVLTVHTDGVARAADDTPGPADHAEAADVHRHLWRALRALDEPYRSLVILRETQGLSYDELADVLDLSMSQVKVYLHRARRRLRHHLSNVTDHEFA